MTSTDGLTEQSSGSVELGGRIKQFRLGRKLTQRQVAEFAEVSVSFLSQLERGVCGASIPTLSMIGKALGLSVADLFSDEPASNHRVLRNDERPQHQDCVRSDQIHADAPAVAEPRSVGGGDGPRRHSEATPTLMVIPKNYCSC